MKRLRSMMQVYGEDSEVMAGVEEADSADEAAVTTREDDRVIVLWVLRSRPGPFHRRAIDLPQKHGRRNSRLDSTLTAIVFYFHENNWFERVYEEGRLLGFTMFQN